MDVKLRYETVAALVHVLSAQYNHAKKLADDEGYTTLLEQWQEIERLYIAMVSYLDKYDR